VLGSLRAKLIAATMAVHIVALLLLIAAGQRVMDNLLSTELRAQARTVEELLAAAIAPQMAARDYASVQELVDDSSRALTLAYLWVYDERGRTVAHAGAIPASAPAPADAPRLSGTTYDLAMPIRLSGQSYGSARVGLSAARLLNAEASARMQTLLIVGSALGVSLLATLLLTSVLTRDLRRLAEASARIGRGDLSVRLPEGGRDEVAQLTRDFNRMAAELQARMSDLRHSEARLQQTNVALEERVNERTAALVAARDAAERASAAKSEFLSRMSHELRTPLNAILGFAQLLRLRSGAAPALDPNVHQIERAGWHLLDLINEVLDLSRIESGTMHVSLEPVALAPLVRECVTLTEPMAGERQITLAVAVDDALAVRADRVRLRQVLVNLLSNAVKYNRVGGLVQIAATVQPAADDGAAISIAVTDTGRGLQPEQIAQLYQPFNRLGADDATPGTGIGLVITKRLVELMNGQLALRSKPGVGTTFSVQLPAAALPTSAAPAPPPAVIAAPVAASRTIFYIEDNPANIELLRGVIALRAGLKLELAADGASGLARARDLRPDLIVIDLGLPDLDGTELCRALRQDPHFVQRPIVALTANAMESDRARAAAAGFDAFFTKPLDVRRFLQQVDQLLAQT
jgi:signal transduction histidine kinase